MKQRTTLLYAIICFSNIFAQTTYPDNETGLFQDMLTPQYYLASVGDSFRAEVNTSIHFARQNQFQHPLVDPTGNAPPYSIPTNGEFGVGKGPTGTSSHHAAIDLHLENNATEVDLFAAHDGHIAIYRDAPKYRHYLSITKNIEDSTGIVLGKMVTLYAHIDLDLDSTDNLQLDGQFVTQGTLVSKHLYAGTVGGPHLHFEIRYYRIEDAGTETYYGFVGPEGSTTLTEPSAGSWSYGYWDPNTGYGFANPMNHLPAALSTLPEADIGQPESFEFFQNYPNPFNPNTTFKYWLAEAGDISLAIYDLQGQLVKTMLQTSQSAGYKTIGWNSLDDAGTPVNAGIYFCHLQAGSFNKTIKMTILK